METKNTSKFMLLIQGILFIILGIYSLSNPGALILTMAFFLRWFLLFTGIASLLTGFFSEDKQVKSSHYMEGAMLMIVALIFIFGSSLLSAAVLIYLLIGWFLFSSMAGVVNAITSRSGFFRIASILLNLLVIAISIQALFNPSLATGIFVFSLSFNFLLLGLNSLLEIFIPRNR